MSVINRMLADLEQRGAPAARGAGALHSPARSPRARRDRKAIAMGMLLLPLAGVAVALWLPPGSVRLSQFAAPAALAEGGRARPMRELSVAAPPVTQTDPLPDADEVLRSDPAHVSGRRSLPAAALTAGVAKRACVGACLQAKHGSPLVHRASPASRDAAAAAATSIAAASLAGAATAPAGGVQRAAAAGSPPVQSPAHGDRARAVGGQGVAVAAAAAVGGARAPEPRAQDGSRPANTLATLSHGGTAPSAAPATPIAMALRDEAAPVAGSTSSVVKRAVGSPGTGDDGARAPRVAGPVHKEERSTAAERAQRRYAEARELIARGQGHAARTLLREVLALDAGHHGARDLLVAVLRHGGEDGEARELLARGLELAPARAAFATPYARLLVDAGDLERAAQVLAAASASGAGDAEFHALSAAIAQQRGQHDEAVAQYTRAIEARGGREGRLWLGLGISLAANGRDDDALRAYRAALDSGDLPVRLHDWARSRIE